MPDTLQLFTQLWKIGLHGPWLSLQTLTRGYLDVSGTVKALVVKAIASHPNPLRSAKEFWVPVCLVHKLTMGFAVVGVINGVLMQETFKARLCQRKWNWNGGHERINGAKV